MSECQQYPAILALGTAVPEHKRPQAEVGRWMAESFGQRKRPGRLARALHYHSGIDTRYSCTPDFHLPAEESTFSPGIAAERSATTADRMAIYERSSVPLATTAARNALQQYAQKINQPLEAVAGTITHLIAISCTGFFAPGLDFAVAQHLKLPSTTRRMLIGFMGCAATFNGLRAAMEIVRGQPQARVLVVSVELCSLHCQPSEEYELLMGASLFSDGASACLVGRPAHGEQDIFQLEAFHTDIHPNTEDQMAWRIRNNGFVLSLSQQIPEHLAEGAPAALRHLFGAERPAFWAIHPGGRAIVDRLGQIFDIPAGKLAASYDTLRNFGNMSSATILFVLAALRRQMRLSSNGNGAGPASKTGVAMAFGPGLVIEMSRLTYVPPEKSVVPSGVSDERSNRLANA